MKLITALNSTARRFIVFLLLAELDTFEVDDCAFIAVLKVDISFPVEL